MRNLLIIGGDSTVGKFLYKSFCEKYYVSTTSRRSESDADLIFNVGDFGSLERLNLPNDLVVIWCINTISGNDTTLEGNVEASLEVKSVEFFLEFYRNQISHFIFLSSDAIFGKKAYKPKTSTPRLGTSNYAQNKIKIEKLLEKSFSNTTFIRMGKIIETSEFLLQAMRSIKNNCSVPAFNNFLFSPIDLKALSETIELLIENDKPRVVHLANFEEISYFSACVKIADLLGKSDSLVKPQKMNILG